MTEQELLNSDLDIFCLINHIPIHIATAGGYIPPILMDEGYILNCAKILKAIAKKWPIEDEVITNPHLRHIIRYDENREQINPILNTLFPNQIRNFSEEETYNFYEKKIYAHSFLKMARMGFLSYDKTNISSPIDDAFHLVATPRYFNSPIAQIFCKIMRVPSFDVPDFNPAHPLVLNSMLYNIPSYR